MAAPRSMKLAGAAVLVTGASTGIGAATARALGAAGARVGLVARRAALLDEVAAQTTAAGAPDVATWSADLRDLALAERVAREAWDRFDGLDGLVNNAGAPKRRHITRLSADEVEDIMTLNFFSPVRMTLAVLPLMRERGRGVIVNVASLAGRVPPPREAAYAASKFALNGFSEVMAVDLFDEPVQVRAIQPGPIETPIWGDVPGNEAPAYDGEFYPPEDCAVAILDALTGEGFERYIPPELREIAALKGQDVDGFIAGSAAFAKDPDSVRPTA
ncbi:MAG TPA: SDR family NAD(P)-dependent oxidoreductase [Mycobacteriales bacterium]|nr:SDR family NAD(P)-dependent oxidoreductase [Mycobacteriales bacterium]